MTEKCRLCGQDDPTINAVKLSTAEARADSAERELAILRRYLTQKKTEVAAFKQELADVKETKPELWDQCITDQICFYRNLAIRYGAKAGDMDNEWDASLVARQEKLDTEIARLKAIVEKYEEKFAKLADGTVVFGNEEVWYPGEDTPGLVFGWNSGNDEWGAETCECYPTREAAEQARLAAGGQGGAEKGEG